MALAPALIVPSAQVKFGLPSTVPCEPACSVPRVKPVGQVSVSETPGALRRAGVADGDRVGADDAVAGRDARDAVGLRDGEVGLVATVVVAVAELFAVMLSLGDVTVAVFDSVPGTAGAVTTIVKVAVAPAAIEGGCR